MTLSLLPGNGDPRRHRGLAIAVGAIAGAATAALASIAVSPGGAQADDPYRQLARFGAVLALVQDKYVDRPDEAKLIEAALRAMAGSLDPHSGYVSGENYHALSSFARGEVAAVGFGIVERDKVPTVGNVTDGTSAAKGGVLPGDRIEAIDGETTEGLRIDQAVEKMRGAKESVVRLTMWPRARRDRQGLRGPPRLREDQVSRISCRERRRRLYPHPTVP